MTLTKEQIAEVSKEVCERQMQEIMRKAKSYGPLQSLRYEFGPLDWRTANDGATEVRPAFLAGTEGGWIRMDVLV